MKLNKGQKLTGEYSNGITTWKFSGTVDGFEWDTAGGNYGHAWIKLDNSPEDRQHLLVMIDRHENCVDSRFAFDDEDE